ncbi:WD40/YVTN/BNR-like repeat-containing protein [Balneola sp. MJW-20]|uniref:WD40/YVTN/BNR-like repeat-containing protein n=1 Tax=Gracilimonas aurantiaca TaxID=3234185 RepID=UPI003467881D
MRKSILLILISGILSSYSFAQNVKPTSASDLNAAIEKRQEMRATSLFKNYPLRNIGPVVMSGRVSDFAVHPENPRIFYTGYASGGVWKTTNSGNTMTPVFDHVGVLGIGDLALAPSDPDILWVGTGENNSSRSSYAGAGVYKSTDGGMTWDFKGLRGSQHIGRILVHPDDANTVWVASMGALYSTNKDRGVYKTTDGGETWTKSLFLNDNTGVIDLVIHPDNPDILWAATWERNRKAWNFVEGGEGSAIWKSTDGGETWQKAVEGFPQGEFVGRIGLDVSRSNPEIVYALLDNQYQTREEVEVDDEELSSASFLEMSKDDFLSLDNRQLNRFLRQNRFPQKYTAERVKEDIQSGKYNPKALSEYLEDANSAMFNTDLIGAEIYRSEDGGSTWEKVNSYDIDRLYNTYGYYFGEIRVDPNDPEVVYILGVPFMKSTDGGKTWKVIADNQPVHSDNQALWIDPNDSEHIILGNDGGAYESHDGGENFIHHNSEPVGQFYSVNVDMDQPYNVYGGLQDNGTFVGSSSSTPNRYRPWDRIGGGDGMHVAPRPDNSDIVYVGSQYGNYSRLDRSTGDRSYITPKHDVGNDRYRYNWNTPINLSHHNPDIVYFGSQKLVRSMDQGETWSEISPDLTNNKPNGDVPYSTLTTIAESPIDFSVIWVGTDDGNVQVTRDGGANWNNVSKGLPKNLWVSEVHASVHDKATAYVSLNGYRFDDFSTYLYKTTDYGKTWRSVKGDLPNEVANVIVQDPVNPNILYAGLDHGSYVSFNDGKNWNYLSQLPNVASYDMVVHPRELDLVIGTHGRSIWIMELEPLHAVAERSDEAVTAIKPEEIRFSNRWGQQFAPYYPAFEPSVELMYYLGDEGDGQTVNIEVLNNDGETISEFSTSGDQGFNIYEWDLEVDEDGEGSDKYIQEGTYTIKFQAANSTHEVTFTVN